jgi:DNA modification methylase
MNGDYINGYIQRTKGGSYEGKIAIDGILLPAISAVYFTKDSENYLWLKRKKVLDYDFESQSYREREANPQWEAYLKKQLKGSTVAYKGEFMFLRFRYSIVGVWDGVLGKDEQRLNLFVERLPMSEQTIVKGINKRIKYDECK